MRRNGLEDYGAVRLARIGQRAAALFATAEDEHSATEILAEVSESFSKRKSLKVVKEALRVQILPPSCGSEPLSGTPHRHVATAFL